MAKLAIISVAIVALLHVYFAYIEIFQWVQKGSTIVPDLDPEMLKRTKAMAANQGLYNLFLVAGLIWSMIARNRKIALFFLGCIVVAGVFGGITVSPKIFAVQAVPAALAFAAVFVTNRPVS